MRTIPFFTTVFLIFAVAANSKSQQIKGNLNEPVVQESTDIDTTRKSNSWKSTSLKGDNDQLIYFTSTSLLRDDRHLIFLSDQTGFQNIFMRDLKTGKEREAISLNTVSAPYVL